VFSPNSIQNLAQIHLVVFEQTQNPFNSNALHIRKNDVTEPKARLL